MAADPCVGEHGDNDGEAARPLIPAASSSSADSSPTDSSSLTTGQTSENPQEIPAILDSVADDDPTPDPSSNPESVIPTDNSAILSDNPVFPSCNPVIPSEESGIVKRPQLDLIKSPRVGGWSLLAAVLSIHRWFRSRIANQHIQSLAPRAHNMVQYGKESDDIAQDLGTGDREVSWMNSYILDPFQSEEQQFCADITHGSSCPHWIELQELSGTFRGLEEELKKKEQEASVAQRQVEQLTKDNEQQAAELMHWTQILKNSAKDCQELHKAEAKSKRKSNHGRSSTDAHNVEDLATLSQLLQRRQEDLRVKEEDMCRELASCRVRIEELTQEKQKLVEMLNSNQFKQSTCEYCREEWRKKEQKMIRRYNDQIEMIIQEKEGLLKEVQNITEEAQFYKAECKKICDITKEHSQQVIQGANLLKSRGFGDTQLHARQHAGPIPGIVARKQQQEPLHHRHHPPHHHHQQASASQLQYLHRQYEGELKALREQVDKYEARCKELQGRLQVAERQVSQHQLVDTALYQEEQANPTLLQGAADTVKNSISMCASNIFKFADQNSLSLNIPSNCGTSNEHQAHAMEGHYKRKPVVKLALQAFLCELVFDGFESPTFSLATSNMQFEKPQVRRRERLQLFQKLRNLDASDLFEQYTDFMSFVQEKGALVINKLQMELLRYDADDREPGEAQGAIVQLVQGQLNVSSSQFHKSFLRLAKAVWLLHKVAFACEPASAEIFRVSSNSPFMEEYMAEHEATRSTKTATNDEENDKRRLVAFMTVPGFTLRNSTIKSIVCCFDSL